MKRYVLAIDLGSSGMRSLLVDADRPWEVTPVAQARYPGVARASVDRLARAFAPVAMRRRIATLLDGAAQRAADAGGDITAIGVTAQRGGIAFLDASGQTVYLGPNTDLRAVFEGAALDERLAADIYRVTGHLPSMFFTPAKLAWWHANKPRTARRIATLTTLAGWAAHELTGVVADSREQAIDAGLLDVATGEPAAGLLAQLEVNADFLPPFAENGSPAGKLTNAAADAARLGRVPVFLSGPDAQCALLGAGVVSPGDAGIVAGWSAPLQLVTPSPNFDEHQRTWVTRHILPERWIVEANAGDTGGVYEQMRRIVGGSPARFDTLAAGAAESAMPTIAVLGPRALDLASPETAIGGIVTPTPVTYHGLSRGAVARATLENIAFALRECLTLAEEVAGPELRPSRVALTGGMAASQMLPGLLADAVGRPIHVQHARASAIGAGIVAAIPVGRWPAAGRDSAAWGRVIEPDRRRAAELDERFHQWQSVKSKLETLVSDL